MDASEHVKKTAGILGTGGKVTKALLEERANDREREDQSMHVRLRPLKRLRNRRSRGSSS